MFRFRVGLFPVVKHVMTTWRAVVVGGWAPWFPGVMRLLGSNNYSSLVEQTLWRSSVNPLGFATANSLRRIKHIYNQPILIAWVGEQELLE